MIEQEPILSPEKNVDDNDRALRPESLSEFIGQAEVRANLKVFGQYQQELHHGCEVKQKNGDQVYR